VNKDKLRPVECRRTDGIEPTLFTGWFLGFGSVFEEFESGPGNQSQYILEMENGEVVEIDTCHAILRFLDRA
jgi:hypothetical protein